MKHARNDYNRIQDPAGLIPEDEPVFLLRGQDMLAPHVLDHYAKHLRKEGINDLADLTVQQAEAMRDFQRDRHAQLPDLSIMHNARVDSLDKVDISKILEAFAKFVYSVDDVRSFNDVNVFDFFFKELNNAERSHLLRVIQTAKI